MTAFQCPSWYGLTEQSRGSKSLCFSSGTKIQFAPPMAVNSESVSLADLTSLLLSKDTSVCSADDSTTHRITLTFCGATGNLLELRDEDRYGGWDRDLDALHGQVRETALYLAQHLGVELYVQSSDQQQPRVFKAASPDMEQVHFEAGRFTEALQLCQQALLQQPSSPAVLRRHGRILSRLDRHSEACDSFRQALRLDPYDTGARLGLAESLNLMGHQKEAIQTVEDGIRLKPNLHLTSALADLLGVDFYDVSFEKLLKSLKPI